MRLHCPVPRPSVKPGQLAQCYIHTEGRRSAAQPEIARANIFRHVAAFYEVAKQKFGRQIDSDRASFDEIAVGKTNPLSPPIGRFDRRNPRLSNYFTAGFANARRHSLGDRPHTADRMSPQARLAIYFAKTVMQQNVSRARRERRYES